MNDFTYDNVKEKLLKAYQDKDGFMDLTLNYPMEDGILLSFHFFDEHKNFFTIGILFYEKRFNPSMLVNQMDFIVTVQLGTKGSPVEISTGNEEWSDFVKTLKEFKIAINDAFGKAFDRVCSEDKRATCEYCKNFNEEAVMTMQENMNKYWLTENEQIKSV